MTESDDLRQERIQLAATAVRTGVSQKLGSVWWSFLLRGLFAIALGIFALFWPGLSLSVLVLAVGIYCIADGAAGLIGALRHPELREYIAQALIFLGIGGVLVFWPETSLRALLVLLGAASLIVGIGQILTARRLPADDGERGTVMTLGVAAAIIGLVLALWPGTGVAVISWVIGIAAVLIGALLVYLGSRFKRLEARLKMPGTDSAR